MCLILTALYTWNDHKTNVTLDEAVDHVMEDFSEHASGYIEKSNQDQIVPSMYFDYDFSVSNFHIDLMTSAQLPVSEKNFWENLRQFFQKKVDN